MKSFDIRYKGKIIKGIKGDKGEFYAILPERKSDRGNEFLETISREEMGWKFSSSIKDKPNYFLNVWLNDDGTMSYNNDVTETKTTQYKFDPQKQSTNFPDYIAKDIYDVAKQFYEHELLGMSAEEVGKLREECLENVLKLLGYQSSDRVKYELSDSAGYRVLGRIGKELEDYQNLAAYVRKEKSIDGSENFELKMSEDINKEKFLEAVNKTRKTLETDNLFIEVQDDQYDRARSLDESFALDMKKKVSPEEWQLYSKIVRNTAELYLELNADLVPKEDRRRLADYTNLTGEELSDKISRLIDSREFDKACNIEDRFVIQEDERFSKVVDDFVDGDMTVKQSTVGFALEAMKREALNTRDKKEKYAKKYEEIEKLYYSKPIQEDKTNEEEERTQDD